MLLRVVYHLVRADFLDRTRRYSFFVMLVLTMLASCFYLPPQNASYRTLSFGPYRGVYNSAWVGMQVAMLASFLLSLVGFYVVKNTIERDQQTGVGQIIATTPLSKPLYTLGKMLSNFAVLAAMVEVTVIVAAGIQFMRAEDTRLDLWGLLSPFLFLTLPAVAMVAALAVLFEAISWLRGSAGNVIFFLLSMAGFLFAQKDLFTGGGTKLLDPFGISMPLVQIHSMLQSKFTNVTADASVGLTGTNGDSLHVFSWGGVQWTSAILWQRLFWLGLAIAIALLSALFFSRFDPARTGIQRKRISEERADTASPTAEPATSAPLAVHLTPLADRAHGSHWIVVLIGEIRLLLKGFSLWWYLIASGINAAMFFMPLDTTRTIFYPLALIWPLFIWSGLGHRETRFHTQQMVFSTAHPLVRQFPMSWLAGVLCTLLLTSGMIIHVLLAGDMGRLILSVIGALAIPSLATAMGVWVGNGRLFEVVYLVWWYAGPVNHVPLLDYMEMTQTRATIQLSLAYLAIALLLLIIAFVGRKRQIQME